MLDIPYRLSFALTEPAPIARSLTPTPATRCKFRWQFFARSVYCMNVQYFRSIAMKIAMKTDYRQNFRPRPAVRLPQWLWRLWWWL